MRRATLILLTFVLLLLTGATAVPAAAAPVSPAVEKVFFRVGEGDAAGVATTPGGAAAYVCGYRLILNHGFDVTIDRVGSGAWSKSWNGPANKADKGNDVAVTAKGAVYVVGSSQKADGSGTALVLKYSSGGNLVWARRWAGPEGSSPAAVQVRIDGKGRVVVVGRLKVKSAVHTYVAQYRSDGKRLWARVYSKGYLGLLRDVCLDAAGTVYVAGEYQATQTSSRNALLLKYSPAGTLRWARTYDSPYAGFDTYAAVCRRPAGGVYVAGSSERTGSDYDGIVMRYSATGTRTVVARLGENDDAYTNLYDAVVTSDGRIVVGGSYSVGSGAGDFVIASFNTAGDQVWSHTLDSLYVIHRSERCEFLAPLDDGGVAASGYWARTGADSTYTQVVRTYFVDAAGDTGTYSEWVGPATAETEVHDLVVKGSYVWIAGQCFGTLTGADGYGLRFDR